MIDKFSSLLARIYLWKNVLKFFQTKSTVILIPLNGMAWIECDHLQWNFHERGLRGSTQNSKFSLPMEIPRARGGHIEINIFHSIPSIPVEWMVQCRVEIPLEGKNFEFFQFHPSGLNVTVMIFIWKRPTINKIEAIPGFNN